MLVPELAEDRLQGLSFFNVEDLPISEKEKELARVFQKYNFSVVKTALEFNIPYERAKARIRHLRLKLKKL